MSSFVRSLSIVILSRIESYSPTYPLCDARNQHGFLHMFPRRDVIVLGGVYKLGDESRTVDDGQTERIVTEHQALFDAFG